MDRALRNLTLTVMLTCSTGCITYTHVTPSGDRVTIHGLLARGEASRIRYDMTISGTNYTRTVTIGDLKAQTDGDQLSVLIRALLQASRPAVSVP